MVAQSLPIPARFPGGGAGGACATSTKRGGSDERVALRMGSNAAVIKVCVRDRERELERESLLAMHRLIVHQISNSLVKGEGF